MASFYPPSVANPESSCGNETEFSVQKNYFVPNLMQSGVILVPLKEMTNVVYKCHTNLSQITSTLLQFLCETII